MKYKLSVVIPTYKKHHKFLQRAINSIDMFDAEIVVVNNDPQNNIEDDGTVNLINLEQYVETGEARNIGVDNANSDLIVFLDSDDWLLPGALQKLYDCYVKNLTQTKEKCIVYGDVIHSNTNTVHYFKAQYQGSDVKESDLVKPNIPYCVLIPKEWHYEIGGYDETMLTFEDIEYAAKFWCYGKKAIHCKSIVYYYNYSETGRLSLAKNKTIHETAKKTIYNNLKDYIEGKKETKFMSCRTCGQPPPIKQNNKSTTSLQKVNEELNNIADDEVGYVVYIGSDPTRTFGQYRFQRSKNYRRKQIVTHKEFNPRFEIHIDDVPKLLNIDLRHYGKIFKFEKEIILPKEVLKTEVKPPLKTDLDLKEAILKDLKNKHPQISEFTIATFEEYINTNKIKKRDVENWLEQEKSAKKPRKGMLSRLETVYG